MEQYHQAYGEFPEATVLIRVEDFYEAYGEVARQLTKTLGLTLTQRGGVPMSGIPSHAIGRRVSQLVADGTKVVLMEHSEDPRGKVPDEVRRHAVEFSR